MHQVQAVVNSLGGASVAARALGVERTVLHRFCHGGKAIERTRARLREGLARLKSAQESARPVHFEGGSPTPSVEDLMAARRVFGSMIQLIDAHVARMRDRGSQYDTFFDGGKDNHGRG